MEESKVEVEYVYRISTPEEWEALQRDGSAYGGDLDKSTGCFHLSTLSLVQWTLQNFFPNIKGDLYLLQVDAKKLGEGLVYEEVDGVGRFPHYYGPSRTFSPLPLESVVKAEKLLLSDAAQTQLEDYILGPETQSSIEFKLAFEKHEGQKLGVLISTDLELYELGRPGN